MMAGRRLLLVTGDSLTAYRWQRGRLIEAITFGADDVGRSAFTSYLAEEPVLPNRMLLDLVEEEFRSEHLPHVVGERRQMLERTAARLFRTTPFRHWTVQGREAEGRRDDRVLFSAVTDPEAISPWLRRLHTARAPLVSIRSVAHLSEAMLKPLGIGGRHVLLVSDGRHSGLRQTYFRDGRLTVSRLSPAYHDDVAERSRFVIDEIAKTMRYLQRLQLLAFDDTLDVYVLGEATRLESVVQRSAATEAVRINPMPMAECTRKLAVQALGSPHFADTLFAQFALRGPARNVYARPRERRYAYHHAAARTLGWGAWLLLAAGLVASAQNLLQWRLWSEAAAGTAKQVAHYRVLHDRLMTDDAPQGIDAQRMRDAVDTVERLRAAPMMPRALLSRVGQVLARYPEFRIDRVRWSAGSRDELQAQADEGLGDPAGEDDGTAPRVHHAAMLEGKIVPFTGDYRLALSRLDGVMAELRDTVPGVLAVEATRRPLDVSSAGSASGDVEPGRREAPYAIRLMVAADE